MTKRNAILKAADTLFSRQGYGLTGVDALALEAGVTKRTLYKQFGSKEALFAEWLTVRDLQTRSAMLKTIESLSGTPKGQLLALFDVLAMLGKQPNFHGCPFSRALLETGSAEAEHRAATVHKQALAAWFTERLSSAEVENVQAMAEELMVLYEGVLQRMAVTRKSDTALAAKQLFSIRLASLAV
jgi:AcrR family transcriptional regulator